MSKQDNKSIEALLKGLYSRKEFEDHAAPTSRRDFLKLGLISSSAAVVAPWWVRSAAAAESMLAPPLTMPFLLWDLAGGAALPGNFLVGQKGGAEDLCENYRMLGWNPRATDSLDKAFGLPMAKGRSQLLAGMRQQMTPDMFLPDGTSYVQMASYLHFSLDDTSSNQASVLSLIAKAGLKGAKMKGSLGMRNSLSGGNSRGLNEEAVYKPKTVASIEDIRKATSLGNFFDGMPEARRQSLLKVMIEQGVASAQQLGIADAGLMESFQNAYSLGSPNAAGDARQDAMFQRIYGINQNTQANNAQAIEASIVMNVLKKMSGPGVITIGGCDYHVSNANTSDTKDREIGVSIGRALRAAAELKTPLFFGIITDGGCYVREANDYNRAWTGDSNLRSMSIVGFYDPAKKPELSRSQVGAYNKEGVVDTTTYVGAGPQTTVLGMLANYLKVNGQLDRFEAVSGRSTRNFKLDEVLVF